MRVRQQYRKTGKKYAESGCCVYTICTQNFCKKCICKVSDIRQSLHKKYIHLYTQKKCDIAKSVHTYIYIQAASIKCIYLSAAESRRYKQKVHTLYIHIHLYLKVYTLYIRINSINTSKSLHFCRQNIRNIRECRWQMESEHGRSFNKLEVQSVFKARMQVYMRTWNKAALSAVDTISKTLPVHHCQTYHKSQEQ